MQKLPRREMAVYMAYAQIGIEMVAPIGLGWFLDSYFQTLPWITVAGAVVGLAGGLGHLISIQNREDRQRHSGK